MYFSEPVLFEIPVYPRTRKFIQTKLQDEQGRPQPLLISDDSQGVSLYLWLTCQCKKVRMVTGYQRSGQKKPMHVDKSGRIIAPFGMTASLGLGIARFDRSRHQYLLNYQELEQFGVYVDQLIMTEMVYHCQAAPDVPPLLRIKEFTALYDFDEVDFTEEALRMAYYRHRKDEAASPFSMTFASANHFRSIHSALAA